MGCQRNNPDWIVAYGAGTLDAPTQAALELHLLECPECRQLADSQKAVWAALDHWPPASVSPDFDEKLYARIARQEQEQCEVGVLSLVTTPRLPALELLLGASSKITKFR